MNYIIIFLLLITNTISTPLQKKCITCKYFMQNKYVSDTIFGQCLFNPTKLDKVFDLISGELIEDNSEYEYCVKGRKSILERNTYV